MRSMGTTAAHTSGKPVAWGEGAQVRCSDQENRPSGKEELSHSPSVWTRWVSLAVRPARSAALSSLM